MIGPGAFIKHYYILEQIGQGGMGVVYLAYDFRMKRHVAFKVMKGLTEIRYATESDRQEFYRYFRRESEIVSGLQHLRILPVYDISTDFSDDQSFLYLVMRYVQCATLEQCLQRAPFPLPTAARLVREIADALDYAHARKVIHRDLKPNNVLIDIAGNAYLADFGLAKVSEVQSRDTSGIFFGSPQYTAPEIYRGYKASIQSDIYSLGAILFKMATGRPVFEPDGDKTLPEQHIQDPAPTPRRFTPHISETAENAILKALAKTPAERYESAGQFAAAFTEATGFETYAQASDFREVVRSFANKREPEQISSQARARYQLQITIRRAKHIASGVVVGLFIVLLIVTWVLIYTLMNQNSAIPATLTAVSSSISSFQTAISNGTPLSTELSGLRTELAIIKNVATNSPLQPTIHALETIISTLSDSEQPSISPTPTTSTTDTPAPTRIVTRSGTSITASTTSPPQPPESTGTQQVQVTPLPIPSNLPPPSTETLPIPGGPSTPGQTNTSPSMPGNSNTPGEANTLTPYGTFVPVSPTSPPAPGPPFP